MGIYFPNETVNAPMTTPASMLVRLKIKGTNVLESFAITQNTAATIKLTT